MAVRQVPPFEAHRFGMAAADPDGQVVEYEEKPRRTRSTLASMGVYVFRRTALVKALTTGPGKQQHNLGGEVIPALVGAAKVFAYSFQGYWADVGTIQAYYEANMALLGESPALDLAGADWVIHTRSEERPAVRCGPESRVERAMLCDGGQVEGTVIGSVLSPGVRVAAGAVVRDAIVMTDAVIEAGAMVDRAIIDKRVVVGADARVGAGEANTPNLKWPERLNTGITVVGKRAAIPPGATIGRNVVISPYVAVKDFAGLEVASGETVGR
jgi:glucose-1-phosphate adenylyltransferase